MRKARIKEIIMMGVCLAIMIVCSKIVIPIGTIPITLQTFAVFICSLILGWKAVFVFLIYLALGLTGLPVYSSGGGLSYVYAPSFGFIIGFVLASPVIGIASKSEKRYLKYITALAGLLIIDIVGVAYMFFIFNTYMQTPKSMIAIIQIGVLPFIIKDIVVALVSCLIYSRIKIVLDKNDNE